MDVRRPCSRSQDARNMTLFSSHRLSCFTSTASHPMQERERASGSQCTNPSLAALSPWPGPALPLNA